jgi:hypothetical protein
MRCRLSTGLSVTLGDSWSVISTGSINAREGDSPSPDPKPSATFRPRRGQPFAALYLISTLCPLQHRHSCEPSCPPAVFLSVRFDTACALCLMRSHKPPRRPHGPTTAREPQTKKPTPISRRPPSASCPQEAWIPTSPFLISSGTTHALPR